MHSREKKSSNSLSKGLVLLVLLIVAFLFYSRLSTKGLPSNVSSIVNSEFESFRDLKELSDEQKTNLKKAAAGFWICQTADSTGPFQKLDRVELLDNGIIWQVTDWFVEFPSGDTASFVHVKHAYLDPFSSFEDSSTYTCNYRIIRQAFVIEGDTCFGESQVDEMWKAQRKGDNLILNRREYVPYNGAIQDFFPPKAIDLVEVLNPKDCAPNADLKYFLKTSLKKVLSRNTPVPFKEDAVKLWIDQYYGPAVFEEMLQSLGPYVVVADSFPVQFEVRDDGSIVKPGLKSGGLYNGQFEKMLLSEIQTWSFPKLVAGSKSTRVSYTFLP